MASGYEYNDTSICSDGFSLSLKYENRSSYGGIYSNLNDDLSITDPSSKNNKKKKKKKK